MKDDSRTKFLCALSATADEIVSKWNMEHMTEDTELQLNEADMQEIKFFALADLLFAAADETGLDFDEFVLKHIDHAGNAAFKTIVLSKKVFTVIDKIANILNNNDDNNNNNKNQGNN